MKDLDGQPVSLSTILAHSLFKGEQLPRLLNLLKNASNIKDYANGQYISANKGALDIFGLQHEDQIIGKTLNYMDETIMRPFWGDNLVQQIVEMERKAAHQQRVIIEKRKSIVGLQGLITVFDIIKIPLVNDKQQVVAILSTSNLIEDHSPFELLHLYRQSYPKRSQAVSHFMQHLKIDSFFHEALTDKEMCCLLHMIKNNGYKYTANQLNISSKTVETHIANIKEKTKNWDINDVLAFLRDSTL